MTATIGQAQRHDTWACTSEPTATAPTRAPTLKMPWNRTSRPGL